MSELLTRTLSPSLRVTAGLVGVALSLTLGACSTRGGSYGGTASDNGGPSTPTVVQAEPAFSQPEVAWPESGYGTVGSGGDGCLSISVPSGSEAYYVKLKSGVLTAWDVFLTPGSSLEFDVPTGTYDLTYGAGTRWYGWRHAFGPDGAYSETSEQFTFDATSCWEVELILQVGGNLGSSGVDYGDF